MALTGLVANDDWNHPEPSVFFHPQRGRLRPCGRYAPLIEDTTMPASSSEQPLYRIDECSDLMADACVCGDQGDLLFLSVWARDTAIQQFIGVQLLARAQQGHAVDRR